MNNSFPIRVFLMLLVFLFSCKSKQQTGTKSSGGKASYRKIAYYNDKFGLQLTPKSNMDLYEFIEGWIGVPHKDNGCEKSGTDCSCFVKIVYNNVYKRDIGKHSKEMHDKSKRIKKDELTEGDLVFFKTKGDKISHVGIYLNNQKFVHVSTSKGVAINSLEESYYQKTYTAAGRP